MPNRSPCGRAARDRYRSDLGVLRIMASADASMSRVNVARALLDQAKALHQVGVATRVDEVRAVVKLRQEEQALHNCGLPPEVTNQII